MLIKKISTFLAVAITASCISTLSFAATPEMVTIKSYDFDDNNITTGYYSTNGLGAYESTNEDTFYSYSGKATAEDGKMKLEAANQTTLAKVAIPKIDHGVVKLSADINLTINTDVAQEAYLRVVAIDQREATQLNMLTFQGHHDKATRDVYNYRYNESKPEKHEGLSWENSSDNHVEFTYDVDNNSLVIDLNGTKLTVDNYLTSDTELIRGFGFELRAGASKTATALIDNVKVETNAFTVLKSYDFSSAVTTASVGYIGLPAEPAEDTFYYYQNAPTVVGGQLKLDATSGVGENAPVSFAIPSQNSGIVMLEADVKATMPFVENFHKIQFYALNETAGNDGKFKLFEMQGWKADDPRPLYHYQWNDSEQKQKEASTDLNWYNSATNKLKVVYDLDANSLELCFNGTKKVYTNYAKEGSLETIRGFTIHMSDNTTYESEVYLDNIRVMTESVTTPVEVLPVATALDTATLPDAAQGRKVWAVTQLDASKFASSRVIAVLYNETRDETIEKEILLGFEAGTGDIDFNLYTSVLNNPEANINLSFRFDAK